MLKDTMDKIEATEKEADEKVAAAQAEAQLILAKAEEKAAKIKADSERHAENALIELNRKEEREAQLESDKALGLAGEEIKTLRELAAEKEDDAVKSVVSIILE